MIETDMLIGLMTLLLSASLFAQRLTELLKAFAPVQNMSESGRAQLIMVSTLVASFVGIVLLCPKTYEILPGSGYWPSVGGLTVLASLGSSFWHDVLKIVSSYAADKGKL